MARDVLSVPVVLGALQVSQLVFFAILGGAFVLLALERPRNDLVAVLIVLALATSRLLTPAESVAGFSSEPALALAGVFVLSAALQRAGVSETAGRWVARLAAGGFTRAIAVIMSAVAGLSAFTHHVTWTAVMLPVVLELGRDRGLPPSKLLMPLSFAASLGTTITIIGAPAFLIASATLQQAGRPGLGIFSLAPIGLALSAAGVLYMVTVGRFLLPARPGGPDGDEHFRLDQYFTEVTILPDSPFLGRTVDEVEAEGRYDLRVVGLVRDGRRLRLPLGAERLRAGDVLLVRTTPDALVAISQEKGLALRPVHQYEAFARPDQDMAERLVQAVVAPGSELVGRTLADIDFRNRYGAVVLSLWRQRGWLQEELSRIRLRAGDVLVLHGDEAALARVAADPGFLMLAPFYGQPRLRRKAPLAAAVMAATIAAASLGVPLQLAMLGGAAAMVLAGCLGANQAYRAIDARISVFIAGAVPLGTAMKKSGASDLLAAGLHDALGGLHQIVILLVLYGVVAAITEFMSDAAATALLAPTAAALAQGLGQAPEPYVVTVAMASVTAFLTPMAHHGNLVVYGPGGYRFGDFARVGAPLTVVLAVLVAVLSSLLWRR